MYETNMIKPYLLVICVLITSLTGCVSEDDSNTYEIFDVINVNGNFIPDTNQDQEDVIKFAEDLINNGSFASAQNIVWEEFEHNFTIESNWKPNYVTLRLSAKYEFGEGNNAREGPVGSFDFSLIDPTGGEHGEGYEIVTGNNPVNERLLMLPPIYGTWKIVISGSGLEEEGALLYSGKYDIKVETEGLMN